MKKIILMLVLGALAAASQAALISYDSFSDAARTNIAPPTGWTSDDANIINNHGYVAPGSLNYSGFKSSEGNSFGLGGKTADYYRDFTSPNLAAGQTVYFSALLRLNSTISKTLSTGAIRLFDSADQFGSGVEFSFGMVTNTTGTMSFSIDNRNRTWNTAQNRTPETYTSADVTYLIIASYTRGSNATNGLTQLWIDPASSSFGAAVAPTATLSTNSYASDANWNRLQVISAGSASWPTNWILDEVRIGTDWASVVPAAIPEPATIGMLGLGALVTLLTRRLKS